MKSLRCLAPLSLTLLIALLFAPGALAAGKQSAKTGLADAKVEALVELKHPRGLNRFVRSVSDPASARYRDYATVDQLVRRYGAEPKAQKRVLAWLAARGIDGTVTRTGTFVTASLTAARAARLLPAVDDGASISSTGISAGREVPTALRGSVREISILPATDATHFAAAKKPFSSIHAASGTPKSCAAGLSGAEAPIVPVTPNQYTTAYGHAAMHAKGLKGEGQTVALVETGGFERADIVAWAKCFGLKVPPTKAIPVAPNGKPLPGELETTLDISMLTAGAPGLDRILVYEGGEETKDVILTAGKALGDSTHKPDVISISLGFCEPDVAENLQLKNALDDIFAVAAGSGISVLVSAGDQGSSGCRKKDLLTGRDTAAPVLAVSLPASSPYATAVGGTNVEFSKKNGIKQQVVWNDSAIGAAWGGGGGNSLLSARTPWWQQGVGFGVGRKVPDIAALADLVPGYALYCTAPICAEEGLEGWTSVGGTSAAAPLTAAGIALANQFAEQRGEPTLGFLNPLLYELGRDGKTRAGVYSDVTVGNNDIGRALPPDDEGGIPLGCCEAKAGYDKASGWGSLKIPAFSKAASRAAP
jgi:subtilase family serine protease